MAKKREESIIAALKIVSPGTALRSALDDTLRSGLGAMIVIESPLLYSEGIVEGGFKINCKFSPQKLFELTKMDGAIIISQNLKTIVSANVLMTPDHSIHSNETGTRHKSSERVAKQAKTTVIAVSERRKKITVYSKNSKHVLKNPDELRSHLSSTIQVLEKQREILEEERSNLSILEMSELVFVRDVCKVLQKTRMIIKISDSVKKSFIELGREGSIIHMRYRELILGVEEIEKEILKDYSSRPLKKSSTILENFTYDGLLDLSSISRLIMEKDLEEMATPKGYRFLAHLGLNEEEQSKVINRLGDLKNILNATKEDLEPIFKNRTEAVLAEIEKTRENVLNGKIIC